MMNGREGCHLGRRMLLPPADVSPFFRAFHRYGGLGMLEED